MRNDVFLVISSQFVVVSPVVVLRVARQGMTWQGGHEAINEYSSMAGRMAMKGSEGSEVS